MKFIELTVKTTTAAEELVSYVLWQHTDLGVAVKSLSDVLNALDSVVYDYVDDSVKSGAAGVSFVSAYFPLKGSKGQIAATRRELVELKNTSEIDFGAMETTVREVEGDDWVANWKKHFTVRNFGEVTVCPSWLEPPKDVKGALVTIDSALAFGTGEHETTAMILEELTSSLCHGATVADIGTGSGILGVSAAKLGAKKVIMTEIEPDSVKAAKDNAERNGVSNLCSVILSPTPPKGIEADVVVANLTAEIIVSLADEIAAITKTSGLAILSGILTDREDSVRSAMISRGFSETMKKRRGEWSMMSFIKSC